MDVSSAVRVMLSLAGKKQTDLAAYFGMSPQGMTNKMSRCSWSTEDLVKAATFTGAQVVIKLPDGNVITLAEEPIKGQLGTGEGTFGFRPPMLYR